MSTTHLDATITTIYATILTAADLTPGFAAKVIARIAERVELMYDDQEREEDAWGSIASWSCRG